MSEIQSLAVIGAGILGRRLAFLASRSGYSVILEDVLPSKLRGAQAEWSELAETAGTHPVRFATTIEEAVRDADLVIDCVPDELESKLEIFSLLDRMAPPRSIFATPTRTLSIADLGACTYRIERCVALDLPGTFWRHGPLSGEEGVTITSSSQTLADVTASVAAFWRRLGFAVRLQTDAQEAASPAPR